MAFKNTKTPFVGKSKWEPNSGILDPELLNGIQEISALGEGIDIHTDEENLTKLEQDALKNLKRQKDLIFKPADKGGQVVIMNREDYVREGLRQLEIPQHYQQIENPIFPDTQIEITHILQQLRLEGFINDKQLEYLLPPEICRERRLYLLPKIHKPMEKWTVPYKIPPGRPIVSDCNSESYKVSELIDFYLKPVASQHPSFLKDTQDFLSKIQNLRLSPNSLLVTLDVDSLYTNIDNTTGIQAVKEKLQEINDPKCPLKYIIKLLDICLSKNDFDFDGKCYLQTWGTAMGKLFAPNYANIFMAKWEREALAKCNLQPTIYLRFLDDIFLIWDHGEEEFKQFFDTLNSHAASIKLKTTMDFKSVDFLDVTVFKGEDFENSGKLDTKVFFKPTDTHELLHKSSFHPGHTFKGILKSQILRFHRICSRECDFQAACTILFQALRGRGYSIRFLRKIKNQTLTEIETKKQYIANSKITKCEGKNCQTCPFLEEGQGITTNNNSFNCLGNLNCNSNNIIYIIKCTKCDLVYVGETGNTLRDRFNQHKSDIRLKKDTAIGNHFNTSDHSLEHLKIMPIEEIQGDNPNLLIRQKTELIWINKLNSLQPNGLNERLEKLPNDIIPFVIPFSKTAGAIVQKVKPLYSSIQEKFPNILPQKLVAAFTRNPNIKDNLVHSKL